MAASVPAAAPPELKRGGRYDPAMPVITTLELEGASKESWAEAAREALREAAKTIRNMRRMEVVRTTATVAGGVIDEFRTEVRIFFEVEPGH